MKEAKVRKARKGTQEDMAEEMVLRIYFFEKCSPVALTKRLNLGQDGEREKMQNRPRSSHAHLISSAFPTQVELRTSDSIGKQNLHALVCCANSGDQRQTSRDLAPLVSLP